MYLLIFLRSTDGWEVLFVGAMQGLLFAIIYFIVSSIRKWKRKKVKFEEINEDTADIAKSSKEENVFMKNEKSLLQEEQENSLEEKS